MCEEEEEEESRSAEPPPRAAPFLASPVPAGSSALYAGRQLAPPAGPAGAKYRWIRGAPRGSRAPQRPTRPGAGTAADGVEALLPRPRRKYSRGGAGRRMSPTAAVGAGCGTLLACECGCSSDAVTHANCGGNRCRSPARGPRLRRSVGLQKPDRRRWTRGGKGPGTATGNRTARGGKGAGPDSSRGVA